MGKQLVIDLLKCRECPTCTAGCAYTGHPDNCGIYDLLESAVFALTCRRCVSAPCVDICPEEALSRNPDGMVIRSETLCVACRSCIAICPFGTLLNDFFEKRKSICDYCNFDDSTASLHCVDTCPQQALSFLEAKEAPEQNIFRLNERVLVREHPWKQLVER